jgi:hypothetical protein
MKNSLTIAFVVLIASIVSVFSQQSPVKPPVGVPGDAKLFNGKWYRVYLEKGGWKAARQKCERLGGQLVVIPDEPTQVYVKNLTNNLFLWLGATDEKVEGLWRWVDGTAMTFTAWDNHQPDNMNGRQHYLRSTQTGKWDDEFENGNAVGFICEWKQR